jgi:hypothetical protein
VTPATVGERFLQGQLSILVRISGIKPRLAAIGAGNIPFFPGQLAIMIEIPTLKDLSYKVIARLALAEPAIMVCVHLAESVRTFCACGMGLIRARRTTDEDKKTTGCESADKKSRHGISNVGSDQALSR